jgi:photosystem II stability/assembly factor-like uncharacterized protein
MKTKIYLTVLATLMSFAILEAQPTICRTIINGLDTVTVRNALLPDNGWGKMVKNDNGGFLFTDGKHLKGACIYAIVFTDSENGWAIGMMETCTINSGVIFHSNDGGQNWELQFRSGTDLKLNSIYFIDNEHGRVNGLRTVANTSFDTLLVTSDGGKTWTEGVVNSTNNDLGITALNLKN